ncbi:MAG: hypothetical protein QXH27_03255 [Candidatus Micrarchaeia archaeon]
MTMEEIAFQARVGNWRANARFEAAQAKNEDIALFLSTVCAECIEKAFEFLEINVAEVDDYARKALGVKRGLEGVAAALREIKPSEAREVFSRAGGNEKAPACEARFLKKLFEEAGAEASLTPSLVKSVFPSAQLSPSKWEDDLGEGVFFSANCRGWISIKKTSFDARTKPEEKAAAFAGVAESAQRKGLEFLGVFGEAQEKADSLTAGKRKGFAALAQVLSGIDESDAVVRAGITHLALSNLGYATFPTAEILQKIYPGLKLPKPRGRFGRGK